MRRSGIAGEESWGIFKQWGMKRRGSVERLQLQSEVGKMLMDDEDGGQAR